MKSWLKSYSLISKCIKSCKYILLLAAFCIHFCGQGQVINYVNNPGFEAALSASLNPYDAVKYWGPLDSSQNASYLVSTLSSNSNNSPYCSYGFQYPRHGNNFILSQFFCNTCEREYPRNRIKQVLKPNTAYCAKYYVVNTNNNRVAISNYGIYAGDNTLDTITQSMGQLTYLTPQVENSTGIITDTLNWTAITGTFVAAGNEKYLVLGNYRSNAATNTLLINSQLQIMSNDIYIDDVSLIELDLPAFACANSYTYAIPGDSVFLGREPDVGIDEDCMWYRLPNDSIPIDTVAGFWAKPVTTTTYVVRQEICGIVKWDTVVVSMSALGIQSSIFNIQSLRLYPIPAEDELRLQWSLAGPEKEFIEGEILNSIGQVVNEADLSYNNRQAIISTKNLANGVYVLNLKSNDSGTVSKRFVISR